MSKENKPITALRREVDDRITIEVALAESREFYADLVSNQLAGIYRLKIQKQEKRIQFFNSISVEFVSDQFCELFEIDRAEFDKNAISSVFGRIHPEDLPEFIRSNKEAQKFLNPYFWEVRLLIEDRIKWIRFESSPRKLEDESIRWTGIALDITSQKQTEETLRNSQEKYRMLLELATDAFFQGDKNGNFIIVNASATKQTGFSKEELLKMNMRDLFSEFTILEKPFQYDQLKLGEIVKSERELVRKDKGVITVEMNSRMMPDGTFQSFFRDITDRKRIENALKRKLSELEIYYELAITRERKMIALKSEINILLERLGEKLKY